MGAELQVIDGFYDAVACRQLLQHFVAEHHWPDNRYQFAGRQFVLPRLQTWHADAGIRYSYSNNLLETRPWTRVLSEIRIKVETYLGYRFNAVLVNCYRDGEDYVGWHADNEPELGEAPYIASVSFGAERFFAFRQKKTQETGQMILGNGSLLIMPSGFQSDWLHSVPVHKQLMQARINLTFRKVIKPIELVCRV